MKDLATMIGIVGAVIIICVANILEGGSPAPA